MLDSLLELDDLLCTDAGEDFGELMVEYLFLSSVSLCNDSAKAA